MWYMNMTRKLTHRNVSTVCEYVQQKKPNHSNSLCDICLRTEFIIEHQAHYIQVTEMCAHTFGIHRLLFSHIFVWRLPSAVALASIQFYYSWSVHINKMPCIRRLLFYPFPLSLFLALFIIIPNSESANKIVDPFWKFDVAKRLFFCLVLQRFCVIEVVFSCTKPCIIHWLFRCHCVMLQNEARSSRQNEKENKSITTFCCSDFAALHISNLTTAIRKCFLVHIFRPFVECEREKKRTAFSHFENNSFAMKCRRLWIRRKTNEKMSTTSYPGSAHTHNFITYLYMHINVWILCWIHRFVCSIQVYHNGCYCASHYQQILKAFCRRKGCHR